MSSSERFGFVNLRSCPARGDMLSSQGDNMLPLVGWTRSDSRTRILCDFVRYLTVIFSNSLMCICDYLCFVFLCLVVEYTTAVALTCQYPPATATFKLSGPLLCARTVTTTPWLCLYVPVHLCNRSCVWVTYSLRTSDIYS